MNEIEQAFKEEYPQEKQTNEGGENIEIAKPAEVIENKPEIITPEESTFTFDPKDFNEKFSKRIGREVKDEKELDEIFSAPTKVSELSGKYKELEDTHNLTKQEYENLKSEYESKKENYKYFDLRKYFANDDLYKTNAIQLKFPDKDASTMLEISNMDLKKADNVDLLIKQAKINDPDVFKGKDDSYIMEVLADRFGGVDLNDKDSWDKVTETKIALAAKQVRVEFEAYQNVELPVPVDVEKLREEFVSKEKAQFETVKNQWSPIVDKMVANFTELVIPDESGAELYKYTPEISDSFKTEVSKFVDYLAYTGQPVNEKTIMDVLENIKGRYIVKELPKIMKAHALKVSTQVNDEWHDKVNNNKPLSNGTKSMKESLDWADKMADMI
jgi:hypothetical protein